MNIPSYPKIYNLGHRAIQKLFHGNVTVQEKVDGSQFSFGVDNEGVLHMRSRGAVIYIGDVPTLFAPAVATVTDAQLRDALVPGWWYRGEAFQKPCHNTLAYDRVPKGNIMLFDITIGLETYCQDRAMIQGHANHIGVELIPEFEVDAEVFEDLDDIKKLLEIPSILGGVKVEGIVFKNYERFCIDGKPMFAKLVSEAFKEKHQDSEKFKKAPKDIMLTLVTALKTEARWEKSVQHLRDAGKLQEAPQDIGPLIAEVKQDLHEEEEEWIKEKLYTFFLGQITRGVTAGVAEWYKDKLAVLQFETVETS